MDTLEDRLEALFKNVHVATTDQVAEALMIQGHRNATTRAIRSRSERFSLGLKAIGHNAWIRIKAD